MTDAQIIQQVRERVPPGSPEPDPRTRQELSRLTGELIRAYKEKGALREDPFAPTRKRTILLREQEIARRLDGRTVLVTGGDGVIGSELVRALSRFNVRRIVSVDNEYPHRIVVGNRVTEEPLVHKHVCDVRDADELERIFSAEGPQVVFHLAAQRLPGLAETQVHYTVSTNVLGTSNVVSLCEAQGVEQCIFSSTGKAGRFFPPAIYAASKKVGEWLFARAASRSDVVFGAVRFTHIVENSPVSHDFDEKLRRGIIGMHAPYRYLLTQNASEAVCLLLNALVLSEPGRLALLAVRDLGSPVDVLEIALYKVDRSGADVPIYFRGYPQGYEPDPFFGQFYYPHPEDSSPMTNALERAERLGDIIRFRLAPYDVDILEEHLTGLLGLLREHSAGDEAEAIRAELSGAVRGVCLSIFTQADPLLLLNILKWGLDPQVLRHEHVVARHHRDIVSLLLNGIYERLSEKHVAELAWPEGVRRGLVRLLRGLPSLAPQTGYLERVLIGPAP